MLTPQQEQKMIELQSAIGSFRLEGLEPSQEAVADAKSVIRGEMTMEQAVKNSLDRIHNKYVKI